MPVPTHPRFLGHKGSVYTLCAAAEAGSFFSGSGDGSVVRWKVDAPETGVTVARTGRAIFAAHLHAQHILLIGDEDGGAHVVDLQERREVQLERAHVKGIFSILSLRDGRIVMAGGDGSVSIWTVAAAGSDGLIALQRKIPLCDEKVRGLALNADGTLLAIASGDGTIRILDTTDLNERFTVEAHDRGANCVAWHPTKPALVSGGKDGHIRLWRTDDLTPLHAFPAHKDTIYDLAFSPEGKRCATASRDKTAKVWDAETFDPLRRLDRAAGGHGYSVNALLWLGPDALITASDDKAIVAWELPKDHMVTLDQ